MIFGGDILAGISALVLLLFNIKRFLDAKKPIREVPPDVTIDGKPSMSYEKYNEIDKRLRKEYFQKKVEHYCVFFIPLLLTLLAIIFLFVIPEYGIGLFIVSLIILVISVIYEKSLLRKR